MGTIGRRPAGARRVRRRSRRLLAAVEREVSPADDAFVVYTSGSTATPKAVVHDQRAVVTKPRALAPIFLMTSDDRTMPLLPAFWLGGIAAALQVLCTGSTLVYPPSPDIDDVLDMIERHDVTYVVVWHTLAKLGPQASSGASTSTGSAAWTASGRGRRTDPGSLRANLLGMSESFSVHSGEPIDHRMPDDKRGRRAEPSTASNAGSSTPTPGRRFRRARSASCSSAAAA